LGTTKEEAFGTTDVRPDLMLTASDVQELFIKLMRERTIAERQTTDPLAELGINY
jgi:hypothetical protein